MVFYIKNIPEDIMFMITSYLIISDIVKLTSTKLDGIYNKSWWIKNYQLMKDIKNYEDLQWITENICKKIIDNMSFIRENFDNKKNIILLYYYIINHNYNDHECDIIEDKLRNLNIGDDGNYYTENNTDDYYN